jgi:hypothetical protein
VKNKQDGVVTKLPISKSDWNRIKRKLDTLSDGKKTINFQVLYSILFSIAGTTFISYIQILILDESYPNWLHIVFISLLCISLFIAIIFLRLSSRLKHNQYIDLREIVTDMNEIEHYCDTYSELKKSNGNSNIIIFEDNCENLNGWNTYNKGKIDLIKNSLNGTFCIRKYGSGDPNGAYKIIGDKFKVGFKMTVLIFSPEERQNATADRLSLENESFNGYGFCINPIARFCALEGRKNGQSTGVFSMVEFIIPNNRWYIVEFFLAENWYAEIKIYDTSKSMICKSNYTFKQEIVTFDRVAIHGGVNYNIDNILIERT